MSEEVRRWCDAMHQVTEHMEQASGLFLGKIEQTNDSGWSPETLWMRRLHNDAEALRRIADRIEGARNQLTQSEAA